MPKPIPSFLRLHVEQPPEPLAPLAEETSALDRFCGAFSQSTGWSLRYEPGPGGGRATWSRSIAGGSWQSSGTLSLVPSLERSPFGLQSEGASFDLGQARDLADAFADVLADLERTRCALWQREAELAAGVPVTARSNSGEHLAARLEAVLAGGAGAVGCQAAALYLLDEATSELKLRAAWGLPKERLLEPARPLRGALGDLEALVGHAVVLEDVAAVPHWKAPEDFPAAVCVPVASENTPLGTLWIFSAERRDFSPQETNLLEIVAGRIASDLEREMLLQANCESREEARRSSAAWKENLLPHAAPMFDGWQVAAWTSSEDEGAGGFYDWLSLSDDAPAVFVGNASGLGRPPGSSSGAALRAAVTAHAMHLTNPAELVLRAQNSLTAWSPGDDRGTLFFARLDPAAQHVEYSAAGNLAGWIVREDGCTALAEIGPPLGMPSTKSPALSIEQLAPHDAIVVIAQNTWGRAMSLPTNLLVESLFDRRRQSAQVLLDAVRAALASQPNRIPSQTSILVVKRRP